MQFPDTFVPNPAQLRDLIVNAPVTVDIWPRGQGKTGGIAFKMAQCAHLFPRGSAAFVARTYKNLKLLILPELKKALGRLGYFEGVHYVESVKPPPKLDYPTPYAAPKEYDYIITWYTGFIVYMVSQDREGNFRGPSIDFIFIDEMLLIKKDLYEKEVLAAKRGNKKIFGHIPLHSGIHACSSKPIGTADKWIMEYSSYYAEDGINNEIIQKEMVDYELDLIDTPDNNKRRKLWEVIQQLQKKILWYPSKEGVFYNETRCWSNIQNNGWKWLKDERRTLSQINFKVEILNDTLDSVENAWYATFNELKHVYYESWNYNHIDTLEKTLAHKLLQDCRWDKDWDPKKPIKLGQDYGVDINFIAVAQRHDLELRYIKEFFVKSPLWMREVLRMFCIYYVHHTHKTIHYYYDHTGNNRNPNSPKLAQEAAAILREYGWNVELRTKGAAFDPQYKYTLAHKILKGEVPNQMYVTVNGNNCPNMILSMKLTPVIQGTKGLKKDKRSEGKASVPQEIATHGGDTFDFILCGEYENSGSSRFIDVAFR